jgi:hypothetical protein
MKVNSRCEVLWVSKPAGFTLDGHDFAVESLSHAFGDWMMAVAQQPIDMSLKSGGYTSNWLQAAAPRPAIPALKEALRRCILAVTPQCAQCLLDTPRTSDFEIKRLKAIERVSMFLRQMLGAIQP